MNIIDKRIFYILILSSFISAQVDDIELPMEFNETTFNTSVPKPIDVFTEQIRLSQVNNSKIDAKSIRKISLKNIIIRVNDGQSFAESTFPTLQKVIQIIDNSLDIIYRRYNSIWKLYY